VKKVVVTTLIAVIRDPDEIEFSPIAFASSDDLANDANVERQSLLIWIAARELTCGSRRHRGKSRIMNAMWRIHQVTRRPLAAFVDFLWLAEFYRQPHSLELILPTGTVDMVVDLAPSEPSRSVLSGVHTHAVELDTARALSLIGARFKPGAALSLLGIPAGELCDATVPLQSVWGSGGGRLREQLIRETQPSGRFRILENFLTAQLVGRPPVSDAVRYSLGAIHASGEAVCVQVLAQEVGLSAVRFSALFRDHVGATPKIYARIVRFRRAIAAMGRAGEVDWTSIALECGYFDQAHFNHDFKQFCGLTPGRYLEARASHPNHVVKAAAREAV
jgi:AraC-like DNA-binding protein